MLRPVVNAGTFSSRGGTAEAARSSSWTARLVPAVLTLLPRFSVEPTARSLGWLYRRLAPRKLERAQENLARALGEELDGDELDALARAAINHQACSLLDTVREVRRPGTLEIEGVDEFRRLVAAVESRGRGQILVTAHLGSWELLNRAATQAAVHGFFALAKQPDVGAASSLLDEVRRAAGTEVLPSGAKSTLRCMLAMLKAGGWIGLAMDQRPDGPGIPVRFFGRVTDFVVGPARMIESQDCGVLAAFCVRTGRGRYRLLARPVEIAAGAGHEDITQRLADELEAAIRAYPEQWLWTYKRWPEPPPPANPVTGDR